MYQERGSSEEDEDDEEDEDFLDRVRHKVSGIFNRDKGQDLEAMKK